MKPIGSIDNALNRITMYRLLVYGLAAVLAGSIIFCLTGVLTLSAAGIALSIVVLVTSCYVANWSIATLFDVPTNSESYLITALILACILPPATGAHHLALVALAGLVAIASKFVLAVNRKHLFNPAAIAVLILGLSHQISASWWIGNASSLILTAILGLLVLRKIRRFSMFFSFLVAAIAVTLVVGLRNHQSVQYILVAAFRSSPLIFLGTIMLTEPETGPPLHWQQLVYGAVVGGLFLSQLRVGSVAATPELALIAGNIYSYLESPKRKLKLRLKTKEQLAPGIYDFGFEMDHNFTFAPGQYLEWTLPNVKLDRRGNRRTFSIASAPGSKEMHMAIKVANPGSAYKQALLDLKPGDTMMAGQLAGNFLLPKNVNEKLVFIAGGIGITPFVSMAQDMIAKQQKRDIILFYLVPDPAEFCYQEVWKAAEDYGFKVIPMLTKKELATPAWTGLTGRLSDEILRQEVSDFTNRRFYLSGPNALVDAYRSLLRKLSVKPQAIVVDHFSGY